MKKYILIFVSALLYCCTAVTITKHPDFNYPPTRPSYVKIYEMMIPIHKFVVIGRIQVDATWSWSSKQICETIQKKAAMAGGDAVILTDREVNVYTLPIGSTTSGTGTITTSGNTAHIKSQSETTNQYLFYGTDFRYGYVIKFVKEFIKVFLPNGVSITAELAVTDEERQQGLMHREKIDSDQGMLFIFEEEDKHSFWMKNMKFSIDILWLDRDKRIVHIERKLPPCKSVPCPSYSPLIPAMYVLELKAGSADENHLKLDDKLEFILPQKNR
jgi:uncharacterized membrane protein (UPF0127 family)